MRIHGGQPTPLYFGFDDITPLDRGNDWSFVETLDGVGCSSFPKWGGMDDADFAVRVEFVKSAAGNKRVWLSEVQGGRAAQGLERHQPVPARDQQRWIWNGYACGADTILFWCWRDEVFGRESAGFGIIGRDGLADERVAALKETGDTLREHGPLLASYQPDTARVGVLFSPQSNYYYYAQEGNGQLAAWGLVGVCRALVRHALPYCVLEDAHLDAEHLEGLKIIFLPRCTALPVEAKVALAAWVQAGGTIVAESECGAFDESGFYAYPEDRWLAKLSGVEEIGRRELDREHVSLELDGQTVELPVTQWVTPLGNEGQLLCVSNAGDGRVIQIGSYPSDAYTNADGDPAGFEILLKWCLSGAGVQQELRVIAPLVEGEQFVHVRSGVADGRRLLFVFAPRGVETVVLEAATGFFSGTSLTGLRDPLKVTPEVVAAGHRLAIPIPDIGFTVLAEDA